MNRFSVAAALAAIALAGCNLTYDREGLGFDSPSTPISKDVEPNDTFSTAQPLTLETDVVGTLGTESDEDYYSFTVPDGGLVVRFQTFDASGATCNGVDPEIYVYDAGGYSVPGGWSDDSAGLCEDLTLILPPGLHYVSVDTASNYYFTPPYDYALRTSTVPAGMTTETVSCTWLSTDNYCEEVTGLFEAASRSAYQSSCESSSGTYLAGPCPAAGSVPGYCDGGLSSYGYGSTRHWVYLAPPFDAASAQYDCEVTFGYPWVAGTAPTLAVTPLFPSNGARWNDWVQGKDWSEATLFNSPCVPDATTECVHAGELLEMTGITQPACTAALTATDALGAFDWICDGSTNPIRFVSTGLKRGVRLRDLIDTSTHSWRPNSVTVWDAGVPVVTTTAARWWANPIAVVPASNHLDAPGTIYVADGAQPGPISIDVSRVALVGPASPAIVMTTAGATVVTADTGAAPAGPRDFLWIEGRYQPEGEHGIQLAGVRRSVIRNVELNRPTATPSVVGLWLWGASHNRVEDYISVGNPYSLYLDSATDNRVDGALLEYCSEYGIYFQYGDRNVLNGVTARHGVVGVMLFGARDNVLTDFDVSNFQIGVSLLSRFGPPPDPAATGNRFSSFVIAANSGDGLVLDGADANRFSGVVSSNNGAHGVHLLNSDGNALVDVLTVDNGGDGMLLEGSSNNRLIGITSARNLGAGVTFAQSTVAPLGPASNNLLGSALSYLNHDGVRFADVTLNGLIDVAVSGNYWYGLTSEGASQTGFAGELRVGPNAQANCNVALAGAGFLAFDCAPEVPGSYVLISIAGLTPTTTFAAAPSDAVNASGGTPVWLTDLDAPTMDWTRFERPHRAWSRTDGSQGPLGCNDPLARTQPACTGTWSGAGTIFDWSLWSGGGQVIGVLAAPDPLVPVTVGWTDTTMSTFLPHAWEILGDGVGNDDGLCEPGLSEACLWTPNFGAYQGHGLLSSPSPTGGANVYHFLTNGY